ncbi:MAG TPA: Rieske 2Fe-2S domain-containing protein [Anaerolineales bacterium]|nr:Rieske 2Fe-2S domain-containing protein [Anaerolineales bacterium]
MTAEAVVNPKSVNRREFLNFAWLVSLGFLTASLGGMTYLFSLPRFKEGEFGSIVTIGGTGDLPDAGSPPVNYPKVKLWLSNTEQGVMALYKVCTHLGCLYNWNSQEGKFICPCHGSQFQPDGTYIRGPAPRNLDRFVIQLASPDGQILAETDPETGGPVTLPQGQDAIIKVDTGRRINGQRHT